MTKVIIKIFWRSSSRFHRSPHIFLWSNIFDSILKLQLLLIIDIKLLMFIVYCKYWGWLIYILLLKFVFRWLTTSENVWSSHQSEWLPNHQLSYGCCSTMVAPRWNFCSGMYISNTMSVSKLKCKILNLVKNGS